MKQLSNINYLQSIVIKKYETIIYYNKDIVAIDDTRKNYNSMFVHDGSS